MKLSEMKTASVRARYRREGRDFIKWVQANAPAALLLVCGYELLAVGHELRRRGCALPKLRKVTDAPTDAARAAAQNQRLTRMLNALLRRDE